MSGARPYEPVRRRRDWIAPPPAVRQREVRSTMPQHPVVGRPPLLLVHGAAMGAWAWERWLPQLADAGWAAYAVSLRGHGDSDTPTPLRRIPLRYYEHDVLQTITELPAPPVLIGHSLGSLLVQHVLERYRAAPAGVLLSPAPPGHALELLGALARHDPRALVAGALGRQATPRPEVLFGPRTPPDVAAAYAARMQRESMLAPLQAVAPRRRRDVRTPLLVMGGAEDRIVPPWAVTRTARIYGTRAHLFRELGHLFMLEEADRPLEVLLRWLERRVTGDESPPRAAT